MKRIYREEDRERSRGETFSYRRKEKSQGDILGERRG